MFSAWDFHSWIASVGVVLFMGSLITGFSALLSALICWIWGAERDVVETPRMTRPVKEPPLRKAA